jgi:hypothetical protein
MESRFLLDDDYLGLGTVSLVGKSQCFGEAYCLHLEG